MPVERPAAGATPAESGGVPPTLAAAESVPRVLVGVLVRTSAWLPPQAVRKRPPRRRAANGWRRRITAREKIVGRWLVRLAVGKRWIEDREATLSLYPNPATTSLTLALSSKEELTKVEVLDVRGATVPAARYQGQGQLDISRLASGLYLLRASDGQHTFTQRFVKQ